MYFKTFTLTLISAVSLAQSTVKIDEATLVRWAKEESYQAQRIALGELSKKAELASFEDKFGANFQASASYYDSKETSFSQYMPVTSPVKSTKISISKPTKYGMSASIYGMREQLSNNFFKKGTTSAMGVNLSIDLYKDLMGRTTRAQEKSLSMKHKIAKKEREINAHVFVQEVRKLYWRLVANAEALRIANGLLQTTLKLEKDTLKRFKNNIADASDLSRTRSQVESRKGQILVLSFERSELVKKLKELFPKQLKTNEVSLAKYNIAKTVEKVMACTLKISSHHMIPKEYTLYDDVLDLLRKDLKYSQKVNNSYSKSDLRLVSDIKYSGKAIGGQESFDEFKDDPRKAYSVGVEWIIPLGSTKSNTEKIVKEITQKQNIAHYEEIEGKLAAFHSETVRSIAVLNQVVAAQKRNTRYLNETLKHTKKKFKQARLSSRDLVLDENSYLQSNLDEINTQYNVISTIIDYFSVFTETPCKLNI